MPQRVGIFAFAIACKFDQPIIHPPHSLDESRITRLGASQVRFDVIVKFASEGKLGDVFVFFKSGVLLLLGERDTSHGFSSTRLLNVCTESYPVPGYR